MKGITAAEFATMAQDVRAARTILNRVQSELRGHTEHYQTSKHAADAVSHCSELEGALMHKAERAEGGNHGR